MPLFDIPNRAGKSIDSRIAKQAKKSRPAAVKSGGGVLGRINEIKAIKQYAKENNVPIMQDEGIKFLMDFIVKNNIESVLEIGSAIGYSAIMMASANPKLKIITIERDQERYLMAIKNVKMFDLEDRITLMFNDALDIDVDGQFDLIFIDAAKAQNGKFFERFKKNLNSGGTIITDNMNFHGLVFKNPLEIESRNLRQLVRKVKDYKEFLKNNKEFETEFLDIGDGLAVSKKIG